MGEHPGTGSVAPSPPLATRVDSPLARWLGMTVEPGVDGVAVAHLTTADEHRNPHGTVHGAVLFALADTAIGAATMSVLDDANWCASIDVQLRFLRPVFAGRLDARAEVLRAGERVVHSEARIVDGDGELVAHATGTFAVLPRPGAG
jgi:acyl-CoA thioesterase